MGGKGAAIAGLAIAGAVGVLAYTQLTKAKTANVASLFLSASTTTVQVNQNDTISVVASDASGSPVANVGKILLLINGQPQSKNFPATDSTGTSSLQVSWAQAGTYTLQAIL